ncbi:MAG: copper resistance protein CopC, partial [Actinobacteria bacterium]|nr:copper resistance protein CopC [Actinomycetota bacterium]
MKRLLALTFLMVMYALPVNAHSALVSSVPAADATVVDFPMEVVLNFNEDLMIVGDENPNKLEVFDSQGALVSGGTVVKGASIAAPVGIVGNGAFSVKYRVVSKDGHVVEGSYRFNVESPIAVSSPMPISAPVEPAEDGSNLLVRIAVLAALGAGIFISLRK